MLAQMDRLFRCLVFNIKYATSFTSRLSRQRIQRGNGQNRSQSRHKTLLRTLQRILPRKRDRKFNRTMRPNIQLTPLMLLDYNRRSILTMTPLKAPLILRDWKKKGKTQIAHRQHPPTLITRTRNSGTDICNKVGQGIALIKFGNLS